MVVVLQRRAIVAAAPGLQGVPNGYDGAMARGLRKKAKAARCTPAQQKKAVAHRKAEAKYVKAHKAAHGAAARAYYRKNKAKIKAQRKVAKTSKHKAVIAARRAKNGGGNRGRPREC